MFVLAIGCIVFGSAKAGTLDPPGPPAPTMVRLQLPDIGGVLGPYGVRRLGC